MTKKCLGCGVILQFIEPTKEGYTTKEENNLCERCFRIKNYNDYKTLPKTNSDFIPILETINKTKDLVVLLIDILNIPHDLDIIKQYLNNDILVVLSKRDVLPDLWEDRLLNIIDDLNINYIDKLIISSKNNYHLDLLYERINQYKKSKKVYIVGFTNSGKSSLINKLIYNYSNINYELTTSVLPSTTLGVLEIDLNEQLTLIDTPGLIDSGNIIDYLDMKNIKKLVNIKTIKPLVYQVKNKQTFTVENFMNLTVTNNNIVFYLPNTFDITRSTKENIISNLKEFSFNIPFPSDLVISGLGFIKITKKGIIRVWAPEGVKVYLRKSII